MIQLKQKVQALRAASIFVLEKQINEFNETHQTFATQIFQIPNVEGKDVMMYEAIIHYKEMAEVKQ